MHVDIDHTGPIGHVSIPIPTDGGIVVLRGPNGAGKSTALAAVDALARPASKLAASVQDGELVGRVAGFGREIRLTAARRTSSGALEIAGLDDGLDLEQLVDPGIDDPKAADRRRITTAMRLARASVPVEAWETKLPTLTALNRSEMPITADPIRTAEALRELANRLALNIEGSVPAARLEIERLEKLAGGVRPQDFPTLPDLEELHEIERQAAIELGVAKEARKQLVAMQARRDQQIAEVRAQLGDDHQIRVAELEAKIQDAKTSLQDHTREIDARQQEIDRVAAQLVALREAQAVANSQRDMLKVGVKSMAKDLEELTATADLLQRMIDKVASTPTNNDAVELAEEALHTASHKAAEAKIARDAIEAARKVADIRKSLDTNERAAAELRLEARRAHEVLADALAKAAPAGLTVEDARLVITRGERKVYFAELSEGERWSLAIELALRALDGVQLITIKQEAWQGLDGDARATIAALAKERRIVIVTAEADTGEVGELRAEVIT